MKWIIPLSLLLALAGCSSQQDGPDFKGQSPSEFHDDHGNQQAASQLIVRTDPAAAITGNLTTLHLMIHGAEGEMLKDFDIIHDQKMHLIIVRDDLDQFDPIHPQVDTSGNAKVSYTFPTGGKYLLYADYKPAGKGQTTVMSHVVIAGEIPKIPAQTPNVPGEVSGDGVRANISIEKTSGGNNVTITFDLMDSAGTPVEGLQP